MKRWQLSVLTVCTQVMVWFKGETRLGRAICVNYLRSSRDTQGKSCVTRHKVSVVRMQNQGRMSQLRTRSCQIGRSRPSPNAHYGWQCCSLVAAFPWPPTSSFSRKQKILDSYHDLVNYPHPQSITSEHASSILCSISSLFRACEVP